MQFIETDKIELKEIFNDSIGKEIETFLNTDGGTIYIGIKDDGSVVGVNNVDDLLKKISDIASDSIEPNSIDCVRPEVLFIDDKIVIKISISKGYGLLYCLKKYGYSPNGCHYRVGTTCKSMTLDMIKRRFEESMSNVDMMIKKESYFQNFKFSKLKMLLLENGYHFEETSFEINLKLKTSSGQYNYLAELLSDKNDIPFIFAKFKGLTKATFSERSDYGHQCFLISYEKMKERLCVENICKTITNPRPRKDIYLFNIDAVNEALVNALIHNDYRISEPQVSFFDNRLEILSHGGLPLGLTTNEFFQGVSKPRNEQLMRIFSMLGIVEHTGHGVPSIIKAYGKEVFDISDSYIKVTIPFNDEVVSNHKNKGDLKDDNVKEDKSIAKQNLIIDALQANPHMTTTELSKSLQIPFRSVQRYISVLKENNIIVRSGANKNGYWKSLI